MTEPMGERGRQGAAPLGGHTPGPWELGARDEQILHRDSDGVWQFIADTHGVGEDAGANARLIAAAPDLLEALDHLLNDACYSDDGVCPHATAAIARARGEQ